MTDTAASRRGLAFIALLAGAAAIGFAPIFVRLSDTSPTASAFWRVALAAPVLWLWLLSANRKNKAAITSGAHGILVLTGLLFVSGLLTPSFP